MSLFYEHNDTSDFFVHILSSVNVSAFLPRFFKKQRWYEFIKAKLCLIYQGYTDLNDRRWTKAPLLLILVCAFFPDSDALCFL